MANVDIGQLPPDGWRSGLLDGLKRFQVSIPPGELFPTISPEATTFSMKNPYAFAIATCLDRGARADVVWTFPFEMDRLMGGLDPHKSTRCPRRRSAGSWRGCPGSPGS